MYLAKSVCPGVIICDAFVLRKKPREAFIIQNYSALSPIEEMDRYEEALERLERDIYALIAQRGVSGTEQAEILEQHIKIAADPEVFKSVKKHIEIESMTCEAAVRKAFGQLAQEFLCVENELVNARATDLEDIKLRLVEILIGETSDNAIECLSSPCILIACELTPSEMVRIDRAKVKGIITESGSTNSHMAIMARSMGIPTAVLAKGLIEAVKSGDEVALNVMESHAEVIISPSKEDVIRLDKAVKETDTKLFENEIDIFSDKVRIYANINILGDLDEALLHSSDGIGLLRSEFLFLGKESPVDEDEQFEAYKKVAEAFGDKPVTIRTLDIGADKYAPYLEGKEQPNPALGLRGIRLCLENTELFKDQLRAILRASAYGNFRVMLPMITTLTELREAKTLIEEIKDELARRDIAFNKNISVGIMIETPAAAIMADVLAKECDFFSIGTNDLTQYIMSADRLSGEISHLFSVYQPAVMRMIHNIIKVGKGAGIRVCMCGEAAGERRMIMFLLSCGLNEFSVAARLVRDVRKSVYELSEDKLEGVVQRVLDMETKEQIIDYLGKLGG